MSGESFDELAFEPDGLCFFRSKSIDHDLQLSHGGQRNVIHLLQCDPDDLPDSFSHLHEKHDVPAPYSIRERQV